VAIRINLDAVLAARGMTAKQLAAQIGVSETHLSMFRSGKVKGVRFSTLDKLCVALACQPADLISHDPSTPEPAEEDAGGGLG
jgi:putative transcriptional regulator